MARGLGNRQVAEIELAQLLRADVAAVDTGLQLPFPDGVAALVDARAARALRIAGGWRLRRFVARIAVFRVAHAQRILSLDRRGRNRAAS
jgi:hypothetical protein